jgi:HSP20 family protein
MEGRASRGKVSLMSMQELTGHESSAEMSDWAGSPLSTLHPQAEMLHPIPFEECVEKNRYVVRFELPGIDPGPDLQVSVEQHLLTVCAERAAEAAATLPSGFGHGRFRSVVSLPARTNDRDVAAVYRNGVLEVNIGWQDGPAARKIKVLHLADVI